MSRSVREMASTIGSHATLVEFGSGVGLKTRKLLDALVDPAGCVLIDISRGALEASAHQLADRYERMEIIAVCADYTQPLRLPRPHRPHRSHPPTLSPTPNPADSDSDVASQSPLAHG